MGGASGHAETWRAVVIFHYASGTVTCARLSRMLLSTVTKPSYKNLRRRYMNAVLHSGVRC